MTAMELPTEGSDSILIPATYDIVWMVLLLVFLLIAGTVAFSERRRGASRVDTFLWFLVTLLAPVLGLIIWAIFRARNKREVPTQEIRS